MNWRMVILLILLPLFTTSCLTSYRGGRSVGGDEHAFQYGDRKSDLFWDMVLFPITLPLAPPGFFAGIFMGAFQGTSEVVVCPNLKCKAYNKGGYLKLTSRDTSKKPEMRYYHCNKCNTNFTLRGCSNRNCSNFPENSLSHSVFKYRIRTKNGQRLRVYFCKKCSKLYSMPGD